MARTKTRPANSPMGKGAPKGNKNAANAKEFKQALKRALAHKHGTVSKGLDKLCKILVDEAEKGEQWAMQMVADRIDGKPAQEISGPDEGPIQVNQEVKVTWHVVGAGKP